MPVCPSCGEELDYNDTFGQWIGGRIVANKGTIYTCPNGSSEDEEQQALCESSCHYIAGYWHNYESDETLRGGYPC